MALVGRRGARLIEPIQSRDAQIIGLQSEIEKKSAISWPLNTPPPN